MGIVVENVTKVIEGQTVLNDISFKIDDGDFATFLSPTGHGKTTLLRVLAGIDRPELGVSDG